MLGREQFDLAVVDGIFFMKCLYLVPVRLQIRWITYSDVADPLNVRVPWLPSFVPNTLIPYTERMSFYRRLLNTLKTFAFSYYHASQLSRPTPADHGEVPILRRVFIVGRPHVQIGILAVY